MGKGIDWLYHRKSCVTCGRAQDYFASHKTAVAETVDARKVRFGPPDALKLLDGMTALVAAKGTKVVRFDLAADRPDDETLLAHLIGPTGNLRAPTFKVGTTLVVGFHADEYAAVFGGR